MWILHLGLRLGTMQIHLFTVDSVETVQNKSAFIRFLMYLETMQNNLFPIGSVKGVQGHLVSIWVLKHLEQ